MNAHLKSERSLYRSATSDFQKIWVYTIQTQRRKPAMLKRKDPLVQGTRIIQLQLDFSYMSFVANVRANRAF
jgi:hypothetical protein